MEVLFAREMPEKMFHMLVGRERDHLWRQSRRSALPGPRETVSRARGMDVRSNADNNVRQYWIEEGIWKDEWGPAWPAGHSKARTTCTVYEPPPRLHPCGRCAEHECSNVGSKLKDT